MAPRRPVARGSASSCAGLSAPQEGEGGVIGVRLPKGGPVPTALDPDLLARVLSRALRRGGDFADVFFEHRLTQTFRLQDGAIREAAPA